MAQSDAEVIAITERKVIASMLGGLYWERRLFMQVPGSPDRCEGCAFHRMHLPRSGRCAEPPLDHLRKQGQEKCGVNNVWKERPWPTMTPE